MRILDFRPPDALDFESKIGILIVRLIGSTVDLMMDLSLVCFVGILFNRLDFADVSLDLDVTRIGILVGSTKGFVFYGVTFDLCRFCTFLNLAQPAKVWIL